MRWRSRCSCGVPDLRERKVPLPSSVLPSRLRTRPAARVATDRHPLTSRPVRRRRRSGAQMPAPDDTVTDPASARADRTVLDARDISRALTRISHELLERNKGATDLVLLGLHTRGVPLARRVAEKIAAVEGTPVAVGELDVTMYRDDLRSQPTRRAHKTALPPGGIDGKVVVLVDDVLFSGRTIRAALDALADL